VRLGGDLTLLVGRGLAGPSVALSDGGDDLRLAVAPHADADEGIAALKSLMRDHLAPADPATRARIIELAAHASRRDGGPDFAQARNLNLLRDGLREAGVPARDRAESMSAGADYVAVVDSEHVYVRGWLRGDRGAATSLAAIAPEGMRLELLETAHRYARPDVGGRAASGRHEKLGFIGSGTLAARTALADGWLLEAGGPQDPPVESAAPPAVTDTLAIRDTVLADALLGYLPDDALMRDHVFGVVDRVQAGIARGARIESVFELGAPPAAPIASVVIPLFEHIEHMKFQLSQFADDPDFGRTDLIYVLDSPDQAEDLCEAARQLYPIYRVPMRICITDANLGFGGASELGASLARADLLLMMNSDVLPAQPGWLARLAEYHRATPECDLLAPKLVHEDGTIQHAGMYLQRPPGSDIWLNGHYFKGLDRSFPAANEARAVPAVSGACMMVARRLFEELGGFPGAYVRGDYEDFDLCMRAARHGLHCRYWPGVELYHLEAQSYDPELRLPASRYNAWLHTHLWDEAIAELMSRFDGAQSAEALEDSRER
jgi:GT2 family glycosyltransferase